MKKKIISLFFIMSLIAVLLPTIAVHAEYNGTCGNDVTWVLDDEGTLTISGNGEMTSSPWSDYASDIKKVIINDGVTSIGSSAFENCSNLTSITIPDGITSIGSYAFSGCNSLASFTIPDSVIQIGFFAFNSCFDLKNVYIYDLTAYLNIDFSSEASNPMCYADNLYLNDELITKLDIVSGITKIPDFAFHNCIGLTNIEIPDNIISIGNSAFKNCSGLTNIEIPDSITSIGHSAFKNCSGLTNIEIPDSITSIGHSAFKNCSSLISIEIPSGVTSIYDWTFENCGSLTSIKIAKGITSIGSSAFENCNGLTNVELPDSVTTICAMAFENCNSLTDITIPNSVTRIVSYAFYGCSELSAVKYSGTKSDWNNIDIDESGNDCLNNAEITYALSVTYNYTENGGDSADKESVAVLPNASVDLTPTAQKEGWEFIGWNIDKDATEALTELIAENTDITLYAIFKKDISASFYSGNNNLQETITVTIYNNQTSVEITAPNGNNYKDYTFGGWRYDTVADKAEFLAEDAITVSQDVTCYAVYIKDEITLTYDTADADEIQSQTIGQYYNAAGNTSEIASFTLAEAPQKDGFIFTGWQFADEEKIYNPGETIELNDSATIYAVWIDAVSITYDYKTNGGSSTDKESTSVLPNSSVDLTLMAQKEDWDFVGWNTDQYATEALTELVVEDTDITLYAIFKKNLSAMFYSENNNLQETIPVTIYNNQTVAKIIAPSGSEYEDYTFEGWRYDTVADKAEFLAEDTIIVSQDVTCYAVYSKNKITLSYNTNGGSEVPAQTTGQYYNAAGNTSEIGSFTLAAAPEKDNYIFMGWNLNEIDAIFRPGATIVLESSTTLDAVWGVEITYNYSENGGSSSDKNIDTVMLGYKADITPIAIKEGWEFVGWNTDKDATAALTEYVANSPDVVLYAIFKKDINISFYEVEQTLSKTETVTIYNNETERSIALPSPQNITDSNYQFIGWRFDELPDMQEKNSSDGITLTKDMSVYAVYTKDVIINYITKDGSANPIQKSNKQYINAMGAVSDVEFTLIETSRNGCDFVSWKYEDTEYQPNEILVIKNDANIEAVWKTKNVNTDKVSGTYVMNDDLISLMVDTLANDNIKIYYTTDGSEPSEQSVLYTEDNKPKLSSAMTLKAIAIAPDAFASDVLVLTYDTAESPRQLVVTTILSSEVIINFNQPTGCKDITVQVSTDLGVNWTDTPSILEDKGVIKATNLTPNTEYLFRISCEYYNGSLHSENVLGKTVEFISSACDITDVLFPVGAKIDYDLNAITSARVTNVYDKVTVVLNVSNGATWNLYESKTAAERNINAIEDKTVNMTAGTSKIVYIRVLAEDEMTYKIYSMEMYRQSKSEPPVFSVGTGSVLEGTRLTLTANGEIIKYTTDGTEPSETNGIIYTSPIDINEYVVIKAVAKESDADEYSDVITNVYYISIESVTPEVVNSNFTKDGYYINFNLINNEPDAINGIVIVALYNKDGFMLESYIQDVQIEGNGMLDSNIEKTFDIEGEVKYYKIFVWNEFTEQGMQPICLNPSQGYFI